MQIPFILFLGDIGGSEILLIMVVILVFFGANKIPELARGLGKGIREFKDASTEIRREFEQVAQPNQPNFNQPQPNYNQPQPNYGVQNQYAGQTQYPTPLPGTPVAETGSGFDPWATPVVGATVAATPEVTHNYFEHKAEESTPPVAHSLPPNLAPEGTQPRQPYFPANSDA